MMRTLILVLLVMLMWTSAAQAQDCTIAAYADPEGTRACVWAPESQIFSVYVVMFVENTVAAAAYSMTYPIGPSGMFLQARFSGPSGNGLVIDESTGTNVALAECVIGFGGGPVLVDEYQFVVFPGFAGGVIDVGPNTSQHPDLPVYVTCSDATHECTPGRSLWLCDVPTEARSFGTIKSLFQN